MKKIIALALAVAGVVWAVSKSRGDEPQDVWAEQTDKV